MVTAESCLSRNRKGTRCTVSMHVRVQHTLFMLVQVMLCRDFVPQQGGAEHHPDHKKSLGPYASREPLCGPFFPGFYAGRENGCDDSRPIRRQPGGLPHEGYRDVMIEGAQIKKKR